MSARSGRDRVKRRYDQPVAGAIRVRARRGGQLEQPRAKCPDERVPCGLGEPIDRCGADQQQPDGGRHDHELKEPQ